MAFEERKKKKKKEVKLQIVLCVLCKDSTWGHGSHSRRVGAGTAVGRGGGGQLQTHMASFSTPPRAATPRFTPQPVSAGTHG